MFNLKHKKLLGIALTAILAACDNGSDGDDQQPPPAEVNLLEAISDMDASYVGDTKFWNHWGYTPQNPSAEDVAVPNPTVTAGTYAGMEGSVLQATSSDFGNADYKAQIVAGNGTDYDAKVFTLKAGKQYTIRFKGAASGPANIKAILQNGDYSNAAELPAELTTTTQPFESEEPFVVGDEDKQVKFIFNIGANPANTVIYIDDVALIEEDAAAQPPPVETPPHPGQTLVYSFTPGDLAMKAEYGSFSNNYDFPTFSAENGDVVTIVVQGTVKYDVPADSDVQAVIADKQPPSYWNELTDRATIVPGGTVSGTTFDVTKDLTFVEEPSATVQYRFQTSGGPGADGAPDRVLTITKYQIWK